MDFGEGSQWTILIPIIILIVLSFVMRRRRPAEKTPQDIAGSLLMDVNNNLRIVEGLSYQQRPKKLKMGSWQRNNEKIDFLDDSLREDLSAAFRMAEDFNMQVESAKLYKAHSSYLSGINVERIKDPLAKSKDGLEEWLKANMGQVGPDAGRPGCFGGGLGR